MCANRGKFIPTRAYICIHMHAYIRTYVHTRMCTHEGVKSDHVVLLISGECRVSATIRPKTRKLKREIERALEEHDNGGGAKHSQDTDTDAVIMQLLQAENNDNTDKVEEGHGSGGGYGNGGGGGSGEAESSSSSDEDYDYDRDRHTHSTRGKDRGRGKGKGKGIRAPSKAVSLLPLSATVASAYTAEELEETLKPIGKLTEGEGCGMTIIGCECVCDFVSDFVCDFVCDCVCGCVRERVSSLCHECVYLF